MTKFLFTLLLLWPLHLIAQHRNVLITDSGMANEPAILLNPTQPSFVLAACNVDNYFISTDSGQSWQSRILSSSYGVWGDPMLGIDTAGSLYYFHLSNPGPGGSWIDRIVCQKSVNQGQNWNNGSYAGLNGSKAQDKESVVIDPKNNNIYISWTEFDKYGSNKSSDSSRILFSRSVDGGLSWSQPLRINQKGGNCRDDDSTVEGAVPAVGPNGEVYVAWASPQGLLFDYSLDGGLSWQLQDIKISDMPGGWDYSIPGIFRSNGFPHLVCDLSNGPNRGRLYVSWTDQRNGIHNTDVWLCYSDNGGKNWSNRKKVNDDLVERHQFFSSMCIDQANGYLYLLFYDRRHHNDNATDVYMAVSRDGAHTFMNDIISEEPFVPQSSIFFGDYTTVAAHNNIVRPIWTRQHQATQSIWTALVNPILLVGEEPPSPVLELENSYPNPASDKAWVAFKLRNSSDVSLQLISSTGQVLINVESKKYKHGKHLLEIPLAQLPAGIYYYVLSTGSYIQSRKIQVQH